MLNRSLMQIFAKMSSPPPPMPCIALAAMSIFMPVASAAMRDPTKKTVLASNRTGLRPQMSLNFPHTGVDAAAASKYADPIHV